MAISIPILSEFNAKGIDKARREFGRLETTAQKAQFAIKKAAKPAALALGGLATAAGLVTKMAIADQAQQVELARTLTQTTGATDAQVKATEAWIAKTELASVTSDAVLRPALGNLVRATGDVTEAQKLMQVALDVAAGTGKDVEQVSLALSKAYGGNTEALKELDPSLEAMVKGGASAEEVMAELAETFGGASAENANTAAGQMALLQISMANTAETIGFALLPIIDRLLPILQSMAEFVAENTTLIVIIGGVIAAFAVAVVAVNAALSLYAAAQTVATAATAVFNAVMAANPIFLAVVVIAAIVAAVIIMQKKFDIFGVALDALGDVWETVSGAFITAFDSIKSTGETVFDAIDTAVSVLSNAIKFYIDVWLAPWVFAFDLVRDIAETAFDLMSTSIGIFGDVAGGVADAVLSVFRTSFNAVAGVWNSTVGGLSFSVPGWVPGIGGKGFSIPTIGTIGGSNSSFSGSSSRQSFSGVGGSLSGGSTGPITVNMPAGSDGVDVVRALQSYANRYGPIPVATSGALQGGSNVS